MVEGADDRRFVGRNNAHEHARRVALSFVASDTEAVYKRTCAPLLVSSDTVRRQQARSPLTAMGDEGEECEEEDDQSVEASWGSGRV